MSLDKFSPDKAGLERVAETYSALAHGVCRTDADYARFKEARKDLRSYRTTITKTGKGLRDDANAFRKRVIEYEKSLVEIIYPVEDAIVQKLSEYEKEQEREKRRADLPDRREKMDKIGVEISDNELLDMDTDAFAEYHREKMEEYAEKQEREKRAAEEKRQREEELERVRREAAERAAREERERAERQKHEAEERARCEAEDREKAEKEERARLEKNRTLKAFIKKHGGSGFQLPHGKMMNKVKQDDGSTTFYVYDLIDSITIR